MSWYWWKAKGSQLPNRPQTLLLKLFAMRFRECAFSCISQTQKNKAVFTVRGHYEICDNSRFTRTLVVTASWWFAATCGLGTIWFFTGSPEIPKHNADQNHQDRLRWPISMEWCLSFAGRFVVKCILYKYIHILYQISTQLTFLCFICWFTGLFCVFFGRAE